MPLRPGWEAILTTLEHHRAALIGAVADELTFTIPLLAVPPTAADPAGHHQRQMVATVARLHDILQTARLDEQLLVYEFAWVARVLPGWGVGATEVVRLIDAYHASALVLASWSAAERAVLEEIRAYLHQITATTFASVLDVPGLD
jgi:hypothetical protein